LDVPYWTLPLAGINFSGPAGNNTPQFQAATRLEFDSSGAAVGTEATAPQSRFRDMDNNLWMEDSFPPQAPIGTFQGNTKRHSSKRATSAGKVMERPPPGTSTYVAVMLWLISRTILTNHDGDIDESGAG